MRIRSVRDLGALVRDRRRHHHLSQAELAARIGASRKWVVDFEQGKPTAEVGLVLKTLAALGIALDAVDEPGAEDLVAPSPGDEVWNLDAHLEALRREHD